MNVRVRLVEIAAAGVLTAFVTTGALAQAGVSASESGVRPNVGSAPTNPATIAPTGAAEEDRERTAELSSGPWTSDNVTAERPFGSINIDAAGNTSESMRTWAQTRSPAERAELSGRCGIIANPSNASRYTADTQRFCRDYMMVANVPTPENPTGVPGATSTGQSGSQIGSPTTKQ